MFVKALLTNYLYKSQSENQVYMKKYTIFFFCILMAGNSLQAQYYYKDIVSNLQVNADMAAYRDAKIKNIKITSLEGNGEPSEGFLCEKKLAKDYRKSSLYTSSVVAGNSLLETFFNEKGQITSTYDSSMISVSSSQYFYDSKERISKIVSTSKSNDDDFINLVTEEHLYEYNDNNLPTRMIRVKNRVDSTVILFSGDEQNNVTIEKDTKTGAKYYYYYDSKNRLTDVVKANEYRRNLVADYLFEYNTNGSLVQMTTTEEGGNDFVVWKYSYENGLRVKERLYNKERKLMGSIEYEYK